MKLYIKKLIPPLGFSYYGLVYEFQDVKRVHLYTAYNVCREDMIADRAYYRAHPEYVMDWYEDTLAAMRDEYWLNQQKDYLKRFDYSSIHEEEEVARRFL
jgi:hypothetical protein